MVALSFSCSKEGKHSCVYYRRRCNPTAPLSQTSGGRARTEAKLLLLVMASGCVCIAAGKGFGKGQENCSNMLLERNLHTLVDLLQGLPGANNARVYIFF